MLDKAQKSIVKIMRKILRDIEKYLKNNIEAYRISYLSKRIKINEQPY